MTAFLQKTVKGEGRRRSMNVRFIEKAAAIACALCLAVGVMRGIVLAKGEETVSAPEPASPEATFVVLGYEGEISGEPGAALLSELAAPLGGEVTDNRTTVPYFVNDREIGVCAVYGDEPYVDVDELCEALGLAVDSILIGDTYTLAGDGIYLEARTGDLYCLCNGRYLLAGQGLQVRNGRALLPMEAMATCFGVTAAWDRVRWTVKVNVRSGGATPLESGDSYYEETDLYWLSRVIYAEAGDQPFTGQLAVGDVVLNRVGNEKFPGQNNVYDVIFAKNQFDVVINGMIYMEPDATSVVAAKLALEGYDVVPGATVFASSEMEGYDFVAQIGDYCFLTEA